MKTVIWITFLVLFACSFMLEVPKTDKSTYEYLELDNGLKCVVISCLDCPQASAALSVGVGSNQDRVPGLAHFLEHMLFYSSKSYPEEDFLRSFLNQHSGYTNAYTDKEETNFYISVSNDALEESLQIFSRAFVEPIFLGDAVDREVKAVNSEHDKNRFDDNWRTWRMVEVLAGIKHPISHFATGSASTLKVDKLVQKVQKFFDDYYKAGSMNLVIYGQYPIDTLIQYAVDYFSDVPVGKNNFVYEKPYSESEKLVIMPQVNKGSRLMIFWALPSEFKFIRSQPGHFISYLLGYSGKNSLTFTMPDLIESLDSSIMMSFTDFSLLEVDIQLTDKGLEK